MEQGREMCAPRLPLCRSDRAVGRQFPSRPQEEVNGAPGTSALGSAAGRQRGRASQGPCAAEPHGGASIPEGPAPGPGGRVTLGGASTRPLGQGDRGRPCPQPEVSAGELASIRKQVLTRPQYTLSLLINLRLNVFLTLKEDALISSCELSVLEKLGGQSLGYFGRH